MLLLVLFTCAKLIKGQCDELVAYSECVNNKRDIVVYYPESCNQADIIIKGIACNFKCQDGYFFDLNNINESNYTCRKCGVGYESKGKTVVYDDFKTLPPGFTTRCNGSGCRNWTAKESILTPGFAVSGATSYLTILFDTLQEEGQIKTTFSLPQVSYLSTFHAFFDGINIDSEFPETTLFYERPHNTLYGRHNLTFVFASDSSDNLTDVGPRISRVEIDGSEYLATTCSICPNGTHMDPDKHFCTRCPRDTFRVANRSSPSDLCQNCSGDSYANPGSAQCHKRPACDSVDDIAYNYTKCRGGQRIKQYFFVEPIICDYQNYNLTEKQPNETVACPKCDPGLYKAASGDCIACPTGTYRSEDMPDTSCEQCPGGTHAGGTWFIRNLQDITDQFKTGCQDDHPYLDEDCAENGWRAREGFLDSGNYHAGPVTVYMNKNVASGGFGHVTFNFTTYMQEDSYFMFDITEGFTSETDGEYQEVFSRQIWTSSGNNQPQNYTGYFYSNTTRLEWFFIKEGRGVNADNHTRISDYVKITGIEIAEGFNSTIGGAAECDECPGGTYAPVGSVDCGLCLAGTASANRSSECTVCTGNTVAENDFARECVDCTTFGHANENHTKCILNGCGFSINDSFTFDLNGLKDEEGMYGPITVPGNHTYNTYSYYINVCTKERSDLFCHGAFNGISTYACFITAGGLRMVANTGALPAFSLFEDPTDSNRYGVNLTYSRGDSSNCNSGDLSSTEIDIICSLDSNNSAVHGRAEDFVTDGCHYHFEWYTEYGCRLCHESDYKKLEGPCNDKKRNVSYAQSASPCAHGYIPPKWYIEACKSKAVQLSVGAVVGIILGAVAIVGVSIVLIVFFVRRNRAIRYQLYQKSQFSLAGQEGGDGFKINSDEDGQEDFKVNF